MAIVIEFKSEEENLKNILREAVKVNDTSLLKKKIAEGADVNFLDENGRSLLHLGL